MNLVFRSFGFLCLSLLLHSAQAERIKDLTSISGVRSNQLVGYGLVVGLDGSGDKAPLPLRPFAT